MNKHLEKAKILRNTPGLGCNCAQAVIMSYAEDLNISDELAMSLGSNFGGGMKCGSVCGAITSGLMVLGMLGVSSPDKIKKFRDSMTANHNGYSNCIDLLKFSMMNGENKKDHCDGLIYEAIELIDSIVD